ncbi:MAG: putative terminase large subunit [Oscillospiraceae bacterium]|nr:putative terminase large subunit [Oscillospiraceae bacterium]
MICLADKIHPTTQYALDVVYGKLGELCCKEEIQACKRHLKDLERVGNDDFPFVFDETRADRIFRWFLECRHVTGVFTGQPIELLDWQKFDLGSVFGWVHNNTGKRRFKTAYIRIARGHAKSTVMSGVSLYGMCGDALYPPYHPELAIYENEPEVVCGAVDKGQAKIVWGDAKLMAEKSPNIKKRLIIRETYVKHKTRGGGILRLSKDVKNKDGGKPCIIIIDEYHAHPTSYVKDTTSGGKGKRTQCLEFIITTAGTDAENKPCYKEDNTVKKILSGEIVAEDYFGIIRQIDDEDDPHDKKCWVKANPLFRDLSNEYAKDLYDIVIGEYNLAFNSGDTSKSLEWLIKRVNRWQAMSEHKYMSNCLEQFKAGAVSKEEFFKLTKGREAFNGLDLSKRIDLTGDGYVIPLDDGRFAVTGHGYIPKESVTKHEHSDKVPYSLWEKENWCTITPGAVVDYSFMNTRMQKLEQDYEWKIKEIDYDPYNATHYAQEREAEGYVCVEIRQGVQTLSEPTKLFRELILQGKIVHDGSPLVVWCFPNAVEESDSNGNIKLSKRNKDDSQRIDVAAAIINAFVRACAAQPVDVNKKIMSDDWSL